VNRYCVGCHNTKTKAGDFTLDTLLATNVTQHPEEWEKVIRKLRPRYMPPVGLPRPDEKTYDAVVASLAASIDSAAAARPNPGRTDTFRRLNRTEYQNSIRDLLALDVDIVSMLPGDEAGHGFDNVTVGNLSPMLLERYLRAAQKISRLAMGIAAKSPGGDTITLPPDLTQEQHFEDLPLGTHGGLVVRYTFPQDAEYDFTVRLQRDRNEHVEGIAGTHEVEVMLDGERVKLVTVKPPGPGNDHSIVDKDLTVRVPVKAGPHVVAATFPKKMASLLETGRQPYQAHFNMDRHPRITPAVYSISVNGMISGNPSARSIAIARLMCPATMFKISRNESSTIPGSSSLGAICNRPEAIAKHAVSSAPIATVIGVPPLMGSAAVRHGLAEMASSPAGLKLKPQLACMTFDTKERSAAGWRGEAIYAQVGPSVPCHRNFGMTA